MNVRVVVVRIEDMLVVCVATVDILRDNSVIVENKKSFLLRVVVIRNGI